VKREAHWPCVLCSDLPRMERGFLCLVRIGEHVRRWSPQLGEKPAGLKIDFGIVVIVFFALAGMVLTLVLAAQPLALRAGRDR
jgi:hypothetical protein